LCCTFGLPSWPVRAGMGGSWFVNELEGHQQTLTLVRKLL
jgi:hypothetical protein